MKIEEKKNYWLKDSVKLKIKMMKTKKQKLLKIKKKKHQMNIIMMNMMKKWKRKMNLKKNKI